MKWVSTFQLHRFHRTSFVSVVCRLKYYWSRHSNNVSLVFSPLRISGTTEGKKTFNNNKQLMAQHNYASHNKIEDLQLRLIVVTVECDSTSPMALSRFGLQMLHVLATNKRSPVVRNPTMAQWARVPMPQTPSSAAVSVLCDQLVFTLLMLKAVNTVGRRGTRSNYLQPDRQ